MKSLEAKLCGLSPAHNIPLRVSVEHCDVVAVLCSEALGWVAPGLPGKHLGQQRGTHSRRNAISICTLLGVL